MNISGNSARNVTVMNVLRVYIPETYLLNVKLKRTKNPQGGKKCNNNKLPESENVV